MDYYSSLDSRSLDSTPTIFEIISSNELNQLLSPSIRYIIVHYAQKYPRYLLKFALNFDEINLILRGLLEHHFLKNWNSTFTEKFYGLKRVSKNKINIDDNENIFQVLQQKKRLRSFQIYGLLISIVGGDYIKEKLNVLFDNLKAQNMVKKFTNMNWRYWYLKLYPLFGSGLKLIDVLFQILYLSGRTKSPSFIDYVLKIEYARLTQFDHDLNEPKPSIIKSSNSRPPSFAQNLLQLSNNYTAPLQSLISTLSTTLFPSAIFLLKFLEWWNSSEFASKLTKKSQNVLDKEIPSPNSLIKKQVHQNGPNCPICHESLKNPAIIETGYVFCYRCIYEYLIEADKLKGGRCPISGKKLLNCVYLNDKVGWKVEGIRRLMI